MSTRRGVVAVLTVLLAGGVLGGCSSAQDGAVRDLAGRFYAAVAADDGDSACDLLAPATRSELEQSAGRPCAQAVLNEDVPEVGEPAGIEVFGVMAQVRFAGETAFLTRFADGWRIVAAACTPTANRYDCSIEGA
jgi:hypothetical protein